MPLCRFYMGAIESFQWVMLRGADTIGRLCEPSIHDWMNARKQFIEATGNRSRMDSAVLFDYLY
jgi:hypothetical protein